MSWEVVQNAIMEAVKAATAIENVQWENTPQAVRWEQGQSIDLRLGTVRHLGVDEETEEYDEDTDAVTRTQNGLRVFTVSVRIKSDNQQPGFESVGALAGRLRLRLRRSSVLQILQDAGVALVRIEPTANADYSHASRLISLAATDVVFSCCESDTDTGDEGHYIHTARVQSEVPAGASDYATHPVTVLIEGSE